MFYGAFNQHHVPGDHFCTFYGTFDEHHILGDHFCMALNILQFEIFRQFLAYTGFQVSKK
jgi:hypothetical protein